MSFLSIYRAVTIAGVFIAFTVVSALSMAFVHLYAFTVVSALSMAFVHMILWRFFLFCFVFAFSSCVEVDGVDSIIS